MLINKSSGRKVSGKVKFANGFFGKLRGLMFESRENFDYALVFELGRESRAGASIHMLFVFFPIDVVYLDAGKRVVDVVRRLKPFALNYTPKKAAKYFVELPTGKAAGIKEGDEIAW